MLFIFSVPLRDHVNDIFPIVPYVGAKMAGIVNKGAYSNTKHEQFREVL